MMLRSNLIRCCIAEAAGTFILVFAGTSAIVVNTVTHGQITHVGIALTFGLVVTALIYALAPISGAHFNPAVTMGFYWAGATDRNEKGRRAGFYILAQLVGACLASLLVRGIFGNIAHLGATLPVPNQAMQSFYLEVILTFILVLVIQMVSANGTTLAGLAIGAVVGLEALFAGPICGASMNPARSLAPALVSGHFDSLWIYLTAPFVGSAIAVGLAKVLRIALAQTSLNRFH